MTKSVTLENLQKCLELMVFDLYKCNTYENRKHRLKDIESIVEVHEFNDNVCLWSALCYNSQLS